MTKKKDEFELLSAECKDVNNNLQIQEELISRLDSQVPKIRNEKEFATTFNRNDDGEDAGSFSSSFSERQEEEGGRERGGCAFVVVETVRVVDGRRGCLS